MLEYTIYYTLIYTYQHELFFRTQNFHWNLLVYTTRYKAVHCSMRTVPECPVPLNETVQDSTSQYKAFTSLVPPYSGVRDFWVLPCTALYSVVSTYGFQTKFSVLKHSTCWYIPVCTSIYQYVPVCTNRYQKVKVCTDSHWYILFYTSTCQYIPAYTSTYQHIPVHTGTCWYVLVCACMCWYVPACTNLDLGSKMVQTRFEPAIFCILFVCFTAALLEYRQQTPDMVHTESLCT